MRTNVLNTLIGGPYRSPEVKPGEWLIDEINGAVQVAGWTDAPIPWPCKNNVKSNLILCGDLIEAVKVESAAAISYHFGVGYVTVRAWQKSLGVDRNNNGTRRLYHILKTIQSTEKEMNKPERVMSGMRVHAWIKNPSDDSAKTWRKWEQWEDDYLRENHLTVPYKIIAKRLKRTPSSITSRVKYLKLDKKMKKWSAKDDEMLSFMYLEGKTMQSIAEKLGRSCCAINQRIDNIGLPRKQNSKKNNI